MSIAAPLTGEDWCQVSREWAAKQGLSDELTPEQIAVLVRVFRPALLEMARERRSADRRPRAKRGAAA